jgi:hypothetical protein
MQRPASGPSVSAMALGAVQLHDGRGGQAGELPVQLGDLRPVARRLGVQRGDRRLENVGPRPPRASARSSSARPSAICSVLQRDGS